MEGGRCASDHRWAVPEPTAMPGGIGLDGTPGGVVGIPVAPICPPYGPTPPWAWGPYPRKNDPPRGNFLFLIGLLRILNFT